jgi:predicted metal-dependent enzyme (double-stranded beta helix superfamily)
MGDTADIPRKPLRERAPKEPGLCRHPRARMQRKREQSRTVMSVTVPAPLKRFIWDIQSMVELAESEREILVIGRDLMARLVASDDWLPDAFAHPDERQSRHYLLYRDALDRFSVVSSVLREGQAVLIHQDKVWEIFGVLRGSIARFHPPQTDVAREPIGSAKVYEPGAVDAIASNNRPPRARLSNALDRVVSIGIHVYGGDIDAISRYAIQADRAATELIEGYANSDESPAYDIWSIQTEIRD